MDGPVDASEAQVNGVGVKRPSFDVERFQQRKKFKTEELPLTAAQHKAIEDLLHSFKKKGGFDHIRKKIWSEFHDGEGKAEFTRRLTEIAESEIEREPQLLSREQGKAATLIEGAVDRSDIYKTVEKTLDALAAQHLSAIFESIQEIRRQEVGDEQATREFKAGNRTDEEYALLVKAKRDEREKIWQEEERKRREAEEAEARRKEEEERRQREIQRQKDEEERARRREREELRRAEQRALDEQREKERQERYERRRREDRERYRDWGYRDRDRSRTRDRDLERDRDRERDRDYRYRDRDRDRSPGYRSERGLSPRRKDPQAEKTPVSKEPTPPPPPPVDEKTLEETALQLLLKEGEELAAKARQKPEFDFEEAEAIENGLKPPPTKPKGTSDSRFSDTPTKPDVDPQWQKIGAGDVMAAVAAQGGDHLDSMTTIAGDHGKPLIDLGIVGQTTEFQFATTARVTEAGGRAAVGAVLSLGHTTEIASETVTEQIVTGTEIEIVTENGGQIETGTANEMIVTEIVTGVETAAGTEVETEVETVVEIVVGLGRTTTGTVDDTATILGHHHHVHPRGIGIVIGNEMETVEGIDQEIEIGTGIEGGKGIVLGIGTGPEIGTGQETGKDTETGRETGIGSGTVKETATKTAIETEIRIGKETEPAIATGIGRDLQRRTKIATVTARETETEIAAEKRKGTEIALAPDGVPQACSTSTGMSRLLAIEVALLVDDCGLQSGLTSGLEVLSK
ncbi:BOD1/SHG1 domain-containing protein [Aspergillus foveolatus]|uniref:BOD1/SHG1 domain-containing protein n=1 Tax=Aspergillus foveolatus TaxID=210207 RepID=UPI003CCE28FA